MSARPVTAQGPPAARLSRTLVLLLALIVATTLVALWPSVSLAVEPWSTGDGAWLWQNPWRDGNTVRDQTFLPDGVTGYRVGSCGLILKTTDGGVTWRQLQSGSLATLTSVSFVGARGCVVGAYGTALVTSDAGVTWSTVASGTESHLVGVALGSDGLTGWAVGFRDDPSLGERSIILKTIDGGASWSVAGQNVPGQLWGVATSAALGPSWAIVVGGATVGGASEPLVLMTQNGGGVWIPQTVKSDAALFAVEFIGDVGAVAVGGSYDPAATPTAEPAVVTTNLGGTWNEASASWPAGATRLFGVTVQSMDNMIAVGENGLIVRSTDGATQWGAPVVEADGPASKRLYCADFLSADQGVAVGADGAEAVTADGGAHWTVVAPYGLVPWSLNDVQARTWRDVWAVGGLDERFPNTVLHTLDGGATWDQVGVGTAAGNSLEAVDFVDAAHGWVLGRDGVALHTEDGGTSWQAQTVDGGRTGGGWFGLDMADAGHGVAVGWKWGSFIHEPLVSYTSDGSTWQAAAVPGAGGGEHLNAVAMADAAHAVGVGSNATIIHTTDGGNEWTRLTTLPQAVKDAVVEFEGVCVLSRTQWWVSGSDGTVLLTTDGGATWADRSLPLPPGTNEWNTYVHDVEFVDVATGWAAVRGTVYQTTDGGLTWAAQRTGSASELLGMDWADRCHGVVVGQAGALLMTRTGGRPDVTGPRTSAWRATAKRGGKARLQYRVDDLQSMTAKVTIKLRNARGKTVQTVSCGPRATGKRYVVSVRLKRSLAQGRYTYAVYARDESGLAQTRLGKATLTVR